MRLGMVGGLLVACARTSQGQTTVGDFVMVQLYIVQLFAPLANLGGSYRMMMQANPNHAHAMHIPCTCHAHAMHTPCTRPAPSS